MIKLDKCPECESKQKEIDHHRCEIICRNCGLILATNHIYTAGIKIHTIYTITI